MSEKPLVIYHAACRDGFAAAWAAQRVMPQAEFREGFYGQPAPTHEELRGRELYVLDFTYPRAEIIRMATTSPRVTILDHHKTAEADLDRVDYEAATMDLAVSVVFDMERSGAGIAWDELVAPRNAVGACVECHGHLHGYTLHDPGCPSRAPWPIRYVEDRDLWRWALPNSRTVNAYLGAVPFTFEAWDALLTMPLGEAVKAGRAVQMKLRQYCEEVGKNLRRVSFNERENVPLVNAPQCDISELLEHLMDSTGETFVMGWWQRADGMFQYSLRSRGDIDVSAIAKQHGGGGHMNAAGFQLTERLAL